MRALLVLLLLAAYIRGPPMGRYIVRAVALGTSLEWLHANELAELRLKSNCNSEGSNRKNWKGDGVSWELKHQRRGWLIRMQGVVK